MRGARINRRVVVIAFLLAVLLGAGGQAVALWSQSSTLTMGVAYNKLPPVSIDGCSFNGNSGKGGVSWSGLGGHDVSHYVVTLYKNGLQVGSETTVNQASFELNSGMVSAVPGDTIRVAVVAHSSGYTGQTAMSKDIQVIDGNNSPLRCWPTP